MDILRSNSPQDNPDDLYTEMMRLAAERAKSLPPNPAYDRVARKLQSGARSMCAKCGMHPRVNNNQVYCRSCRNEYARDNARKHHTTEKGRQRFLFKNYGITKEEYDLMFFQQGGVCAICGQPETAIHGRTKQVQPLSVDHDHTTGLVRALLCNNCNHLLGYLEQNRELAKKALLYLHRFDM